MNRGFDDLFLGRYQPLFQHISHCPVYLGLTNKQGILINTEYVQNCDVLQNAISSLQLRSMPVNRTEVLDYPLTNQGMLYTITIPLDADEKNYWLVMFVESGQRSLEEQQQNMLKAMLADLLPVISGDYENNLSLCGMASELATRYEELNLLYGIDKKQQQADLRNEHDIINDIMENCSTYMDVELVAIYTPDDEQCHYILRNARPSDQNMAMVRHFMIEIDHIVRSTQQTLVVNRDTVVDWMSPELQLPYKFIATPILKANGHLHGIMVVANREHEADFTNSDRRLSEVIASDISRLIQARRDPLTGLLNRKGLEISLDCLLRSDYIESNPVAMLLLDLDQFKMINDSYGHAAGDELLKKLSASLRVHVRGTDTLARLGGDEFGILLYSCSLDKARLIADGLRQLVEDFRFIWKGKTLRVGVSIGLVEIDNSWKDLTEVLNAADTACYIAKDSGRNRIHVYRLEDAENQGRNGEMQMIQNIQYALEQGSFELFQQTISPLISTKQHVKHCEVLTRMRTEAGDVINAEDYVPTAERYRLMPQIDRWVVRATIHAMHFNHPSLTDMDLVSINISAQSLSDERFLQYILELLAENNVRADRLCFEISEASYLNNQGRADVFINRLRDRGCRFALDNFGAVSSVFNTLKTIDMDYLKIDGAFVQDIVDDEMERNMVESINHMGHRIGMRTVVQHISDQKTLDVIREMGVDFAQGYCIEQPHPISDLQVMAGD